MAYDAKYLVKTGAMAPLGIFQAYTYDAKEAGDKFTDITGNSGRGNSATATGYFPIGAVANPAIVVVRAAGNASTDPDDVGIVVVNEKGWATGTSPNQTRTPGTSAKEFGAHVALDGDDAINA